MTKPALQDILKLYGIGGPTALQKIIGKGYPHAKKLWEGRTPISKAVAKTLKKWSKGAMSIDFIFGTEDGRK